MKYIGVIICLVMVSLLAFCNGKKDKIAAKEGDLKINKIAEFPSQLKESSGLCFTDGNLWSFADGGNAASIFKIDTTNGNILQTVNISNFPNVDWEDITADDHFIYIGDFGNNHGNRKDLKILRIKKSDLKNNASVINVNADAINFSYSDQTNFEDRKKGDFDCEALIAVNSNLYIFSKDGIDFKTRCYKLPVTPGSYQVAPISNFNVKGKITGAAYNITTKEIALTGYLDKHENPFIWLLNDYKDDQFFSGRNKRINIGKPNVDWQVEGITFVSNNKLLMSCETSNSVDASLYSVIKN